MRFKTCRSTLIRQVNDPDELTLSLFTDFRAAPHKSAADLNTVP